MVLILGPTVSCFITVSSLGLGVVCRSVGVTSWPDQTLNAIPALRKTRCAGACWETRHLGGVSRGAEVEGPFVG